MIFLPGEHTFNVMANVTSVTGFNIVGMSANTSTIVCSGLGCGGFCFDNVTGLNVTQLSFVSDSHSIITKNVYDFQLVNCIFANSSNTAIIANNSNLHIEGNTFINNTGGTVQQMTFVPGGGIAVISSIMTLQGENKFLNLACATDICGGGAMYAENSTVDLAGNTTFINNTANSAPHLPFIGGGGGLLFFNTTVSMTGYVSLVNNSVSNSYYVAKKCEVGGGGVSLILCNASISGNVILSNNLAEGHSACGGGIYLYESSVAINETAMENDIMDTFKAVPHSSNPASAGGGPIRDENLFLTDNYAGYCAGGIYMEKSNMDIYGTVSLTSNSVGSVDISVCFGGGIVILSGAMSITGNLLLSDNYAGGGCGQGGGMNVQYSTMNITGTLSLTNNSAAQLGGGLVLGDANMAVSGIVSFVNNSATHFYNSSGGGLFTFNSNTTIKDALFANNHVSYQGGGINAQDGSTILLTGKVAFIDNKVDFGAGAGLVLTESTMDITAEALMSGNSAGTFGGGIAIQTGSMSVRGSIELVDNYAGNYAGGLSVIEGTTNVTGMMSFVNNSAGVYGAGITMSASIMTMSGMVHFIGNEALAGGAIFVNDSSSLVYCASDDGATCLTENCFFQIGDKASLDRILMVFEHNVALAGSVLFGGSVDRCVLEGYPEAQSGQVFDMIANYSTQLDTVSTITSYPYRVCVCNNSQLCSASNTFTAYAYPGQTIPITVAAMGQRNGSVSGTVNAIITNPSNLLNPSTLGTFQDRQRVSTNCNELHYTFFSNLNNITLVLYIDGSCSSLRGSIYRLQIPVHLFSCPPAFNLSRSTDGCVCEERLQKYTNSCNINLQTILRDKDFWVGYDNQSKGLILHPHCPFDYCQTKPTNFTMNNTDLQCRYNRTGLLCGACPPGLSLAMGSSRCLPCSDAYLSLLLPFAIMGLVLVAFMLICRLTVALGTISGLVFYANIVGANQSVLFPPDSIYFLRVFISWLNLDLGIETCFYDGMDAYVKTWLQFVFPIYIWGVIGLIMFISAHSFRLSRMLGSNPVAVLATLFLLSYAKILRAILSALSITTLEYPNDKMQVVWLSDGNITYLHGKHIPLFVVGILFLLLIFLPYTLLLLLGQWLQKFSGIKVLSWMNNLKLKAFLEAYYAPYMIKHRYWTGLLLVARLMLLPVFAINVLGDDSENLLAISAASFGLLVWPLMIGNIYKNWKLRALNASYILNLGIFAVATNYVQQTGGNQAVVTYISTGIAFVTFFATVLGHLYFQIEGSALSKKLCCKTNEQLDNQHPEAPAPIPDPQARPLIAPSTTYVGYGSNQIREPLLDAQ